MIRKPERIPIYLRQYQRVPLMLSRPYDVDLGAEILNHLIGRDGMEAYAQELPQLADADQALSSALAAAESRWLERLQVWSSQCGFSKSLWWISVQYNARRGSTTPLSLIDVIGSIADAWVKAFGKRMSGVENPVRTDTVASGFHQAMLIGVVQHEGLVRERVKRGPRLPRYLSRFAQALPVIVIPGSVMVGFQLPREIPGELASPPAAESQGALDIVMAASARYTPDGDADAIADIVEDGDDRIHLWDGLKSIYNAASPEVERMEIVSRTRDGERVVPWVVSGKAIKKPQEVIRYTLEGSVRAIDLDRRSLRVRMAGCPWTTAVTVTPSLFLQIEDIARAVIGQSVTVEGTTRDTIVPPRSMVADSVKMG